MKKFIYIFLLLTIYSVNSQQQDNRFLESEENSEISPSKDDGNNAKIDQSASRPGNPDGEDDLPIDDYIPVLVMTALGLILYTSLKKKKVS